jgi:hypothetical protein
MSTKSVLRMVLTCSWGLASLGAASASAQVMDAPDRSHSVKGRGPDSRQQPRAEAQANGAASRSHLDLVLRLSEDGGAELVRVAQLPGDAVLSDVPVGNYVYEVKKGSQTIAVESFGDPFERRSFPLPGEDPHGSGHHLGRAPSAQVVVKVPKTALADGDLDRLSIRVARIEGAERLEAVNEAGLARLKADGKLDERWEMSGGELAGALRSKGRVVR